MADPGGQIVYEEWGSEPYPERPDQADCIYYLKTGICGFGSRCRYNHPRDRIAVAVALTAGMVKGEYPERAGQPECQYYMRTGMCKYGSVCKYHHPKGVGSTIPIALNLSGYPLRPGEKECTFFMKTGQCKYGLLCKFHHPENDNMNITAVPPPPPPLPPVPPVNSQTMYTPPPAAGVQNPSHTTIEQYGVVASNWPVPNPGTLPGSYIPAPYPVFLPPGMIPYPGWNPYQPAAGGTSIYGITQLPPVAPAYTGTYLSSTRPSGNSQTENVYPDRPGQPECHYYAKTGQCKYGSACKYHHPPPDKQNHSLSLMGLPLRPGGPICYNYAQNGVCRYGPTCKFDHPMVTMSYSPSASSLTDMPVSPYQVGSTSGTLAPSSSSSDLKHGPTASKKDSCSTRMSSSVSTPTGSTFSKPGSTNAAATTVVPSSTSGGSSNTSGNGKSKS